MRHALRKRRPLIRVRVGQGGAAPKLKDELTLVFWFGGALLCTPARYFWEGGLLVGRALSSVQAALMPR